MPMVPRTGCAAGQAYSARAEPSCNFGPALSSARTGRKVTRDDRNEPGILADGPPSRAEEGDGAVLGEALLRRGVTRDRKRASRSHLDAPARAPFRPDP